MTAVTPTNAANLLTPFITQSQQQLAATQQQLAQNAATSANSSSSAAGVATNYTTFLKILTAQLKNQDPLAAADTNQFTQELVEFSGVEQQLSTNKYLQQLVNASVTGVKSVLNYVGQFVEVPANNQLLLQNGVANLAYTLPSTAQNVAMAVQDAAGHTIAMLSGPTTAGLDRVSWNGQDANGNQLPDGVYKLALSANDPNGNPLAVTDIRLIGQVTSVQTADSSGNDLNLGSKLSVNDANVDAVFSPASVPSNNNSSTPSS